MTAKAPHTTTAEWIVAGLSALLVLGVIGFLIYDAVSAPATPPDVRITVDSIARAGPGYVVLFQARNGGRTTAAEVLVRGELAADSGLVESSEATLDYVPAGGEQHGGLYFTRDPHRLRLKVEARGYREP